MTAQAWGDTMQPGGVPLPDIGLMDKAGRMMVLRPEVERTRKWLTGGLPAPQVRADGWAKCSRCGGKVRKHLVDTHVPGSWPVGMVERHACVAPAAA